MSEDSRSRLGQWNLLYALFTTAALATLLAIPLGGYMTLLETRTEAYYLLAASVVLFIIALEASRRGAQHAG